MSDELESVVDRDEVRYVCEDCNEHVRAGAYEVGTYPNGFDVRCGCVVMDSCPYEMSQAETPDSWVIERPECCRDVEATELETVYGGGLADVECPECGWQYKIGGEFVSRPDRDEDDNDEEQVNLGELFG